MASFVAPTLPIVELRATGPGPVSLYPALSVEPQATIADFDARHPEGAKPVIVLAISPDEFAAMA
jgi:hypothetical protein